MISLAKSVLGTRWLRAVLRQCSLSQDDSDKTALGAVRLGATLSRSKGAWLLSADPNGTALPSQETAGRLRWEGTSKKGACLGNVCQCSATTQQRSASPRCPAAPLPPWLLPLALAAQTPSWLVVVCRHNTLLQREAAVPPGALLALLRPHYALAGTDCVCTISQQAEPTNITSSISVDE